MLKFKLALLMILHVAQVTYQKHVSFEIGMSKFDDVKLSYVIWEIHHGYFGCSDALWIISMY